MLSLPLRRATVLALAGLSVAAAATQARPMAPKVLDARVSPSAAREGQQVKVRVTATPGNVRVVLELRRGGRNVRVWASQVPSNGQRLAVALPRRLHRGAYRVSTVAIDQTGSWSPAVNRSLRVLPRR